MASPSSSSSYLNSTREIFSLMDLNEKHAESMEEMETEWSMDVPDTPDQLVARKSNGRQSVQMESSSSISNLLRNPDFMVEKGINGMKGVGVLASENGYDLRLDSNSKNTPADDFKDCRNTIILSPRENSYSQNHFLLRKGGKGKYSFQRTKPFNVPRRVDKGIAISVDSPSKPPACQENTVEPKVREPDRKYRPQIVSPHISAVDCKIEKSSNKHAARCMPTDLKRPSMIIKGKEKVEDSFQDVGLSMIHKKEIEKSNSANNRHEKQVLNSRQFVNFPRAAGHKRLVRNGCISPHNIATKTKCLAEQSEKSSRAVDQSNLGNMPSSRPSCLIDIKDIVAEDNCSTKDKGKGIIREPSTSHVDDDDVRVHGASSSDTEKAVGANPARTSQLNTSECSEEVGSWRITHNNSRKGIVLPNPSGSSFKNIDNVGRFSNRKTETVMERQVPIRHEQGGETDCAGNADTTQRASGIVPRIDRTVGLMHAETKLNKRQKKIGSTSQIHTSSLQDAVPSAPGESSNSRSTRLQSQRICDNLNEVIEVDDELSPVTRHPVSQTIGCPNDDTSDAKARQLEADEMLARELQEQLYQEMPVEGPVEEEIDEHLAMALQQVDGLFAPSRRTYNSQRGSSVSQENRRTRSQSLQNSNRTRAQVTHSARMSQMRNQFFGGSHRASTRQRNVNFPLHMDLDMRLDILEALEAAVGDMEDVRTNRNILHIQRDFNENDYEMLLSLDENNHQHAGASTNRINSLPQSTVQTDSTEETCAICLETPTIGDVIRHLPCLHKFHKDCIDLWLQRRTSCPVCKLSIT